MPFFTQSPSDLVRLLEALYDLEQPRDTWFRSVLKAASSALDRGTGVGALLYDVSEDVLRVDVMDGVNVDARNFEMGGDYHRQPALANTIIQAYRRVVCATLADQETDPQALEAMRERYAGIGLGDQVMINGANPSGFGCVLYVFSSVLLDLAPADRDLMTRIAAHLSTAYRLQRRLELTVEEEAVDAVLKTDGHLEHAEPAARSNEARESLQGAVRSREWARGSAGRRDPEKATSAWKPLVSGRWSLVDRYEVGGRRYITARENMVAASGPKALSPRERQVVSLAGLGHSNKSIAYELGLAHSTVRVLLARAGTKLGTRTRSALVKQVLAAG